MHHMPGCRVFTTCYRHGKAGGIAFIISPKCCSLFDRISFDAVVRGRIGILRCCNDDGMQLDIVNAHIFHESMTASTMHRLLRASLSDASEVCTFVVGDMNDVAPDEGRLDVRLGALRFSLAGPESITETLHDYAEIVASGYTRRQSREGEISLLSRIDRVFCSLPTGALLRCRAGSAVLRSIFDLSVPSDHAPIALTLHDAPRRKGPRVPPTWVSSHPMFATKLQIRRVRLERDVCVRNAQSAN